MSDIKCPYCEGTNLRIYARQNQKRQKIYQVVCQKCWAAGPGTVWERGSEYCWQVFCKQVRNILGKPRKIHYEELF